MKVSNYELERIDKKERRRLQLDFLLENGALGKFMKNMHDPRLKGLESDSPDHRITSIEECMHCIPGAFHWKPSPEGYDYWALLDSELSRLMNGAHPELEVVKTYHIIGKGGA